VSAPVRLPPRAPLTRGAARCSRTSAARRAPARATCSATCGTSTSPTTRSSSGTTSRTRRASASAARASSGGCVRQVAPPRARPLTSAQGRKAGPTLSYEVKTLIGEGNQAYVDNNTADAARIMQEVIRIEPRAASAWTVLAQCYTDLGEHEKALQLRIMSAHLLHDAEEWDRLARQSRCAFLHGLFQPLLTTPQRHGVCPAGTILLRQSVRFRPRPRRRHVGSCDSCQGVGGPENCARHVGV
jgi:hypothetical protein